MKRSKKKLEACETRDARGNVDEMLRVVLDTNVIVSAIIAKGKPRELFQRGISHEYILVTPDQVLQELTKVLTRPKFKTSQEEIKGIISTLSHSSESVETTSRYRIVREDPSDDIIINAAHDAGASQIVTGDKHMLRVKEFKETKIVTVNQMLEILRNQMLDEQLEYGTY